MSILLDALRKSERQERLGSVPGIYSQEAGDGVAGGRSPGRIGWLMMAVVFVVLAWLTWRQFAPEDRVPPVPAESAADAAGAEAEAASTVQATQTPLRDVVRNKISPATEGNGDDSQKTRKPVADARTPMETLPRDDSDSTSSSAARQEAFGPAPDTAVSEPAAAQPKTPQTSSQTAAEQAPRPSSTAADSTQGPGQRDRQPPPVNYWQLPTNIRDQLPELRITVLVFAEEPADRFVLLNGRRRMEGDPVSNGLRLEEIRRDGAVFTYRMYRFFVDQ